MKKIIYCFIAAVLFMGTTYAGDQSDYFELKSYGHFKKMVETKNVEGVVDLNTAIPPNDAYAVGILQNGRGQITVINNEVWLDYGKDFIGFSVRCIPDDEKAAMMVTAQVPKWKEIKIPDSLPEKQLFQFILSQAGHHGLDTHAPFPFLIEGIFDRLSLHVTDGVNPGDDESKDNGYFLYLITQERYNQQAVVIGFYSADTQGVYTQPGKSWHLHAVIKKTEVAAHVDYISARKNAILKLPVKK